MKKTLHLIIILTSVLLLGGLFWSVRSTRAVGSAITLARVTIPLQQSGIGFRITNNAERAMLLTDLIVETNSPSGWQAFSHTMPTHPQRLSTGDTKDLVVAPPTDNIAWRLRVTYGTDVKGPMLLLGKAGYAISRHTWPGQGFGIMVGSNSCITEGSAR